MPYITAEARARLDSWGQKPATPGELNYVLTTIIDEYLQQGPINYAALNAAVGVIECVKQEFYRRVAVPYEEEKLLENGDVYSVEADVIQFDPDGDWNG